MQCPDCSFTAASKAGLTSHRRSKHAAGDQPTAASPRRRSELTSPPDPTEHWEVYIKWFADEALGFYCRECRRAVDPARKCTSELALTPAKLTALVAAHIRARHPDG